MEHLKAMTQSLDLCLELLANASTSRDVEIKTSTTFGTAFAKQALFPSIICTT